MSEQEHCTVKTDVSDGVWYLWCPNMRQPLVFPFNLAQLNEVGVFVFETKAGALGFMEKIDRKRLQVTPRHIDRANLEQWVASLKSIKKSVDHIEVRTGHLLFNAEWHGDQITTSATSFEDFLAAIKECDTYPINMANQRVSYDETRSEKDKP